MQAVFHVKSEELNLDFINMIKNHFAYAKLDIVVHPQDETDYLNSSQRNRERLEAAIQEAREGGGVTVTPEEIGTSKPQKLLVKKDHGRTSSRVHI